MANSLQFMGRCYLSWFCSRAPKCNTKKADDGAWEETNLVGEKRNPQTSPMACWNKFLKPGAVGQHPIFFFECSCQLSTVNQQQWEFMVSPRAQGLKFVCCHWNGPLWTSEESEQRGMWQRQAELLQGFQFAFDKHGTGSSANKIKTSKDDPWKMAIDVVVVEDPSLEFVWRIQRTCVP